MIRTDRIGDVVLTLPLFEILRLNFPESRIDFLVNKRVFELVSDYPNINKVHPIEKDSLKAVLRICRTGNYELAIVVRPLFSIASAIYLAGIRYRLGTGYRWYSFLFNLRHYQHRKDSLKHELEYNIDLLEELGIHVDKYPAPKLRVMEEMKNQVRQKLVEREIDPLKKFIIIHPGAGGSALLWSSENFLRLIQLLTADREFDYNIILTGTEAEKVSIIEIVTRVKGRNVFYILDFNLKELAALISLSELFVSNSTGTIHIAAAVGTFAVGLYPQITSQSPVRWAPCTDKKKIFVPETRTSGIGKEQSKIMDSINPAEVYRFIKSYISKN